MVEDIRNDTWRQKINASLPAPYLITPEWVYDKFLKWVDNSPMWQARVMGEFPIQGEDTLIPLQKIEAATVRELIPKTEDTEQIGVDVARFGSDKTVFVHRKGPVVTDIKVFSLQDTMETAERLFDFSRFHPFGEVHIDEIGVGAGVADRMRQLEDKKPVVGVNVGLPAHDTEMFYNLRAEMYWGLRDRFITGDISIPANDDLMSQLANLKFEYTPKGQVKIESKEEMKKRGLPSPDIADALVLAFGAVYDKPNILSYMETYKT
jgi:phage terminase large subunit